MTAGSPLAHRLAAIALLCASAGVDARSLDPGVRAPTSADAFARACDMTTERPIASSMVGTIAVAYVPARETRDVDASLQTLDRQYRLWRLDEARALELCG